MQKLKGLEELGFLHTALEKYGDINYNYTFKHI